MVSKINIFEMSPDAVESVFRQQGMIKIDLHICFSWCSANKLEQLIKVVKKKGISGIAATNHNTIKRGVITSSLSPSDFHIIIGSEISRILVTSSDCSYKRKSSIETQ